MNKSKNKSLYLQMELYNIYTHLDKRLPIIANLPHSGRFVPEDIAVQFNPQHLQSLPNTDWHLDKLYDFLPSLGITVMQANYSRYVVDLNREIKEPPSGNFWSSVVPLQTAFGQPIYTTNPNIEAVQERLEKFYIPYHNQMKILLQEKVKEFGKVYLLDLHSFGGIIDDQICLGNVNDKSCSEFMTSTVEKSFTNFGYQVVINKIFTGGYITRHYSQIPGVEALQIELRYHVYLDEKQLDKLQQPDWNVPNFYKAKSNLTEILSSIVSNLNAITC